MRIGVFDSGEGGHIIGNRLQQLFPTHSFEVIDDSDHVPYGSRSDDEIIALTNDALQPLLAKCPIIIIACNTATAAAISYLRDCYPATQFIGFEPMLKTAATSHHHFTVLATPSTLQSRRYQQLKQLYCSDHTVDEPDTSQWASLIERGLESQLSYDDIRSSITSGSTAIVIACTHYLAVQEILARMFPDSVVLEPTYAVTARLTQLLALYESELTAATN